MPDDSEQVGQDEIEKLLQQTQQGGAPAPSPPPAEEQPAAVEAAALDQGEIEALMQNGPKSDSSDPATPAAPSAAPTAVAASASESSASGVVDQGDIESLLNKAEKALGSIEEAPVELPPGVHKFDFEDLTGAVVASDGATLELMRDVQLDLKIELGRTHMYLEDVLQLKTGAVVTLDKLAGDPVDIFVNGRLIARGEVVVLNDNFCVRVAELVAGQSACA